VTPAPARRAGSLLLVAALAVAGLPGALLATELGDEIAARGLDPAEIVQPSAVDDDMRAWLAARSADLAPGGTPEERLEALLAALVDPAGFGLRYSGTATLTAREVFEQRVGNCLAFTHLFVALARELGLEAYYVEVHRTPRFEQSGDLVVVWEHVTAGFGPTDSRLTLEFAAAPPVAGGSSRRLSDLTAVAMHYSNRGAELLRAGELSEAVHWLETAVVLDPGWSHAWLNLGVTRRRRGDLVGAEAAYRHAIVAAPDSPQPYFNLAGLLSARGDRNAAHEMLVLLKREDNHDPFVHLALGDLSLAEGRLGEAHRFYRRAVRLAPDTAEPRSAIGLWALRRGRRARAERALDRAEGLSEKGPRFERLKSRLSGGGETSAGR
jgi:Flp pilus assembly protein TadD